MAPENRGTGHRERADLHGFMTFLEQVGRNIQHISWPGKNLIVPVFQGNLIWLQGFFAPSGRPLPKDMQSLFRETWDLSRTG